MDSGVQPPYGSDFGYSMGGGVYFDAMPGAVYAVGTTYEMQYFPATYIPPLDDESLKEAVRNQMCVMMFVLAFSTQTCCVFRNYYFSDENLSGDIFLRRQVGRVNIGIIVTTDAMVMVVLQMDDEGFIPLSLVAGFYRVQSLCQDLDKIRQVCFFTAV